MTTHEAERGVVSCAICLTQKSSEEAYLDGCFHRFCLSCITRWTDSQRQHPPSGAAPGFVCPLCKTPYASILHDYHHNAYKRKWVAHQGAGVGSLPDGAAVDLTSLQRRRRASYFSPCSATRASSSSGGGNGAALLTAAQAARPEVAVWLRGELEALMLDSDVSMVVAHVVGTLRTATGGQAKHRRGAASTAGASREAVAAAVAAAAQPYVFEHAARFAQELSDFAASGRSIAAHDLATGMAGGNSEPAAASAAATVEEGDGSRESGELSPSQPSDSQEVSSSGDGAAAADAAAGSGETAAAAAAGPAGNADAGSGARRSPSPDRGSDCLSLSIGSDFGDSDSEAYLPLVQASAAAQRRKLAAAVAGSGGGGSEPEPDGDRTGGGAEHPASSPPCSKRRRSHLGAGRPERQHPNGDSAADRRRGQGPDAHGSAAADLSKPQRQHKRRRQRRHDSQQPAKQPRVAAQVAAEPKGAAAAAAAAATAEADAQRMLRRAAKFGMPAPSPPLGPSSVATAAAAPSTNGNPRGTAINSNKSLKVPSNSQGGSSSKRQAGAQPHGSRPSVPPKALQRGQLRPFVEVEAVPAQAAAIESPTVASPLLQQGGNEASDERISGQQHRKRQRRLSDSQSGGLQPLPTPRRSSASATVRSGNGAAQGASDAARRVRKQGHDGVPSLGGGLRIFRSALAGDKPPLHSRDGSTPRAGHGGAHGGGAGRGQNSDGADSGVGSGDLELLRQRALAAHAVTKP